jgi:hypothetical protein
MRPPNKIRGRSARERGQVITTSCTVSDCSIYSNALFAKRHLKVRRRDAHYRCGECSECAYRGVGNDDT